MLGKERIGPIPVIETTAASVAAVAAAKDASQTHSNPAIQQRERRPVTMLKVLKPTLQGPIHVGDDDR